MATLKRTPRDQASPSIPLDRTTRHRVVDELDRSGDTFFPIGSQVAMARRCGEGTIVFALFPKEFPSTDQPALVVEDRPSDDPTAFGVVGRIWLGSPRGLKQQELSSLDAEAQKQLERAVAALRSDLTARLGYRAAEVAAASRQAEAALRQVQRELGRAAAARADLLTALGELADRYGPQGNEPSFRLSSIGPAPPASPSTLAGNPEPPVEKLAGHPGP